MEHYRCKHCKDLILGTVLELKELNPETWNVETNYFHKGCGNQYATFDQFTEIKQ